MGYVVIVTFEKRKNPGLSRHMVYVVIVMKKIDEKQEKLRRNQGKHKICRPKGATNFRTYVVIWVKSS